MSGTTEARLSSFRLSTDHGRLISGITRDKSTPSLIIQDLDGVCMPLVRDPMTRVMDPGYVHAAAALGDQFRVLTNGEHIGRRGVNAIVERALGPDVDAAAHGLYLPGLAAGGVQVQDRFGRADHPGLNKQELSFLASIPKRAERFLHDWIRRNLPSFTDTETRALVRTVILDNAVSPTLNINAVYPVLRSQPALYADLQQQCEYFLGECLADAVHSGMSQSFFIHLAPNLGRDRSGREIVRAAEGTHAGTTDFQFMVRGAVKEAGVLVLLNRYAQLKTGTAPLGEDFHIRQCPRSIESMIELIAENFDRTLLPRLIGIGDTMTSSDSKRGGSDRGFLLLIQEIGKRFDLDNAVLYVDSSHGEVPRPGIDQGSAPGRDIRIEALKGITDSRDPLKLNFVFPGGHEEYVAFFKSLVEQWQSNNSEHN